MDAKTAQSMLELAESSRPKFRGAEAKAAIGQLEMHSVELLGAIEWLLTNDRVDEARRLASALVPFWLATKRLQEGIDQLERVLAADGGDDRHRGRVLYDVGYVAFWKGEDEKSSAFQHEAIAVGRRSNNATVTALALVGLARIALRSDVEMARRLCREAIAETEGSEDEIGRSSAMHVLGVAAQMAGDFVEAKDVMSRRIALAREKGNLYTISSEAGNLSMVERQLGNLETAELLAAEALEIDFQTGNEMAIPWKVNGLAAVAAERGELERAATLIGIADFTLEAAQGAWPPDELAQYQRTVAIVAAGLGTTELDRARNATRAMTTADAVAFALRVRA